MSEIQTPLVSVIMTVYNSEKYLSAAVDSILNQSFVDFEFIIINDGSTDNCSNILKSFKDKRIRLIERENRGLSASLNEGISVSMGKYIARMDHDDISLKDRLKIQYEFMEENPDIGILGTQAFLIDESGKRIGSTTNPISPEAVKKCVEFVCPLSHPTYFVRRKVYEDIEGYRYLHSQDYDFLLRSVENGTKICNLKDKLLLYRTVQDGMSLNNLQMVIREWFLIKKAHKIRARGRDDASVLKKINNINLETSNWFKYVYRIKSKLSHQKNDSNGFLRIVFYIAIGAVSLLHYQLFSYEYCHFRAKLIADCH